MLDKEQIKILAHAYVAKLEPAITSGKNDQALGEIHTMVEKYLQGETEENQLFFLGTFIKAARSEKSPAYMLPLIMTAKAGLGVTRFFSKNKSTEDLNTLLNIASNIWVNPNANELRKLLVQLPPQNRLRV